MKYGARWVISDEKKEEYIGKLLPQLATLRARVGVSQDELANLVGISRQTYCLTESGSRSMSWNTFLSVIMFYDYNNRTHKLIRNIGAFPEDLFYQFNLGEADPADEIHVDEYPTASRMINELDENGMRTLKAVLASEWSRCRGQNDDDFVLTMSELVKQKTTAADDNRIDGRYFPRVNRK